MTDLAPTDDVPDDVDALSVYVAGLVERVVGSRRPGECDADDDVLVDRPCHFGESAWVGYGKEIVAMRLSQREPSPGTDGRRRTLSTTLLVGMAFKKPSQFALVACR